MQRDMQDRLIDSSAHVQLMRTNQNEGIREWRPLLERLSKLPHVIAAAPELDEQVVVAHGAREGYALIEGIVPENEKAVSKVLTSAPAAAVKALEPATKPADDSTNSLPPLIIGKDLADTVGVGVGDSVKLISPQGELTPMGMMPQILTFKVVGTYHTGFYQYDSNWGFIRLGDAQRLYDEPDLITVISFRVDHLNHAPEIARQIEAAAGPGFQTTNWKEQNRELFRALRLEQIVTFIVITLIVIVAALNILIALTMMVMEKTRDVAVLMSFGVDPSQVRRIFLLQGFLISLTGTILGLILGYIGAWAGSHYHIGLTPDVYAIDTLPFAPRIIDGVIVAIVSIGISLLATLYPSYTASRIRPAEALRYE
jgi:lipoprotein-releasing system permease protein